MLIPAVCGYFHSADSQGSATVQMGTREKIVYIKNIYFLLLIPSINKKHPLWVFLQCVTLASKKVFSGQGVFKITKRSLLVFFFLKKTSQSLSVASSVKWSYKPIKLKILMPLFCCHFPLV